MQLAHDTGLPSPKVMHVLQPRDELGTASSCSGSKARPSPARFCATSSSQRRGHLARQLGRVAAGIHGLPAAKLPSLRQMTATKRSPISSANTAVLTGRVRCLNWRCAGSGPRSRAFQEVTLVHGDFRHGNLIIGPDGVRAVLDWELAHFGDPMEDLGWICVNSWRLARSTSRSAASARARNCSRATKRPAARPTRPRDVLGSDGHAALGHHVLRHDAAVPLGPDHSMERAMIGRRSSETEIDLLRLLAPRGG